MARRPVAGRLPGSGKRPTPVGLELQRFARNAVSTSRHSDTLWLRLSATSTVRPSPVTDMPVGRT